MRRPRCGVMQDCRIRWGTVESVEGEHAVIVVASAAARPTAALALGEPGAERVQWKKGGALAGARTGAGLDVVSAHWDWVCGRSRDDRERRRWTSATQATLELVNAIRSEGISVVAGSDAHWYH